MTPRYLHNSQAGHGWLLIDAPEYIYSHYTMTIFVRYVHTSKHWLIWYLHLLALQQDMETKSIAGGRNLFEAIHLPSSGWSSLPVEEHCHKQTCLAWKSNHQIGETAVNQNCPRTAQSNLDMMLTVTRSSAAATKCGHGQLPTLEHQ